MKSWDPFRDLLTIQDRMNKLFETVLTGPVPLDSEGEGVSYWRPVAEVVETADSLEIECELAGLDRSDIQLRVEAQMLIVEGERPRREAEGEWTFHQLERPFGRFVRKFELPEGLDLDQVQAALEEGVLRVTLPKRPDARSREIELN
ncbi:MAG: Hsp20/alpha crystallin family protein [Acidobacteriota bacterium]|nr:Hsp20/alpha crystallin family protein [Acidobacteriota bacterium]MDQ7086844.1 Hsp20/alpha crystallin family protein [Acidobacteriota bacterium]